MAHHRAFTIGLVLVGSGALPPHGDAHLIAWGSWEVTHRNLQALYPDADPFAWRIKRHTYVDAEARQLEEALGVELYPEERVGEFFVAVNRSGNLLGVATFIDPRSEPKIVDGSLITLEVGVGVNLAGVVDRIRLYDYRGDAALGDDGFLSQLRGRNIQSSFTVEHGNIDPSPAGLEESQLVATAVYEALLFMKVAMGRRS